MVSVETLSANPTGRFFMGRHIAATGMPMGQMPSAAMLKVILEEVQQTRKELREHIADENKVFDSLRQTIHENEVSHALTRQRLGVLVGVIAVFVSGLFTYLLNAVGFHFGK